MAGIVRFLTYDILVHHILTCLASVLNGFQGGGAVVVDKGELCQVFVGQSVGRHNVDGRLSGPVAILGSNGVPECII